MVRSAARVVANDALSPTVRRLLLRVESADFAHAPGQAVVVEAPGEDGALVRAPYSIASGPGERGAGVVEIVVSYDAPGSASRAMHALAVGTPVTVEGPVGTFIRTGDAAGVASLFVAAGTGLSPLRAMIASELGAHPARGPRLVLLYGARTEEDILWREEIEDWTLRSPRLFPLITLSRASESWSGRRGYVQLHLDEAVRLAGSDAFAFVCGPEAMVTDVMATLHGTHLPEARVVRERYG